MVGFCTIFKILHRLSLFQLLLFIISLLVITLAENGVLSGDKETAITADPRPPIANHGQKCANKNVFWRKIIKHMIPFKRPLNATVRFFLYKRDFRDCGYELLMEDDDNIKNSGLNISDPTRYLNTIPFLYIKLT